MNGGTTDDGNLLVMSSSSSSSSSFESIDLVRNIDYHIDHDRTTKGHEISNDALTIQDDINLMSQSRPSIDQSESIDNIIDQRRDFRDCDVIKQEVTKIMNFKMQNNLRKPFKSSSMSTNLNSNIKPQSYFNADKRDEVVDDVNDKPIDYSVRHKRRRYSQNFNSDDDVNNLFEGKSLEAKDFKNNWTPKYLTGDRNIDPYLEFDKEENIDEYWPFMMKRNRCQINNFDIFKLQQWSRGYSSNHPISSEKINKETQQRHLMGHLTGHVNFYAYQNELLQRFLHRNMWMSLQSEIFQAAKLIDTKSLNFSPPQQNIPQHSLKDENFNINFLKSPKSSRMNRSSDDHQPIEKINKSNQSNQSIFTKPINEETALQFIPDKIFNKSNPNHNISQLVRKPQKDKSIMININQSYSLNRSTGCLGDFICQLCGERFEDSIGLAGHNCSKMTKMKYECTQCDKVFNCPANLASHRRWHKPKQC